MPAARGSTTKLVAIAEVTAGTTPATPTMLEMVVKSFSPRATNNVITDNAIRSHPFTDRILAGTNVMEFGLEYNLDQNHDLLWETFFGQAYSSNTLKFVDALKTLSMESQTGGTLAKFDHYLGSMFSSMGISVSASDTEPVAISMSGRAMTSTLDDAATIATAVTGAGVLDPFTFIGGALTIGGAATKIMSGTINLERAVDPLMEVGSANPTEFVPGACKASGNLTVAYRDAAMSDIFEGFTQSAQVYTFSSADGTKSRALTFPKTRFLSFGRSITSRGIRTQEISWEAEYDTSSATVLSVVKDDV